MEAKETERYVATEIRPGMWAVTYKTDCIPMPKDSAECVAYLLNELTSTLSEAMEMLQQSNEQRQRLVQQLEESQKQTDRAIETARQSLGIPPPTRH